MGASRRSFLRCAVTGGTGLLAGCLGSGTSPTERVRTATAEFDDLSEGETALAGTAWRTVGHVRTEDGGLGEAFVHADQATVADPDDLDPARPTLLFCRLTEDGRYDPTGVGWSVPAESTGAPPELFGREFHDPSRHHVPNQSDHYGLHAWVFEDDEADSVFGPVHPELTGPSYVDTLDAARSALSEFRTLGDDGQMGSQAAEAAGYEDSEKHVYIDDDLYGVPFHDADVTDVDVTRPPILLYRMTDQWYYELLGAEWHVPADDVDAPPELFEQQFHEPNEGHSPQVDQPEHYGLHAWLFRANPLGMFAPANPRFK